MVDLKVGVRDVWFKFFVFSGESFNMELLIRFWIFVGGIDLYVVVYFVYLQEDGKLGVFFFVLVIFFVIFLVQGCKGFFCFKQVFIFQKMVLLE